MRFSIRYLSIALVLALMACLAAIFWNRLHRPWPPKSLGTAYYVWQMQWNDGVRDALTRAAPSAGQFMVLLGEVDTSGAAPVFSAAQLDWKALAASHVKTTAVLRARVGLNKQLNGESFDRTRAYISNILQGAIANAKENGLVLTGVQLDYDSPTSGLAAYRRLLDALRSDLPGVQWSITTLPTWLKNGDFSGLVAGLSYYVLQVHSLEPPTTIDRPAVLFDPAKTAGYLRRAASIGAPFYLALPTYGYQVAFDESGKFLALSAEGPSHAWKPGVQVKTIMSNPEDIAAMVRSVTQNTPPPCLGIVWFRLPVESDDLNWTWSTLEAVRNGRPPTLSFKVEVRNPSSGLYEIWITNTGEFNTTEKIQFDVFWQKTKPLVYDLVNSFQAAPEPGTSSLRLTGSAPRQGKPLMAGWFRFSAETAPADLSLRAGDVTTVH